MKNNALWNHWSFSVVSGQVGIPLVLMALTVATAPRTLIMQCGTFGCCSPTVVRYPNTTTRILDPLRCSAPQVIKLNTELPEVRPEFREASIPARI